MEQRAALFHDDRLQGREFTRAYAALVDHWLGELLGSESDVALVAVGGYGQGELAPGSDIDVILLHDGHKDIADVANRLWYPIWDVGIRLDHGVKTLKEAIAVAQADLKAAIGLVTARTVAGSTDLGAELVTRGLGEWRRHAKRWLPALRDSVLERHDRLGDVAFLLEPDLKEGRGGLRDVTSLHAVALAAPVIPDDDVDMLDADGTLVAARVALHRLTGKSLNRLNLQDQDAVAEALGATDADALMQAVATAARTIGWASDDAWRRAQSWLEGPSGHVSRADRPMSTGVVVREGEIVATASADMSDDSLVLRVAVAAATTSAPIARPTLERLRAGAALPTGRWSAPARVALIELLAAGPGTVAAFEALDQYGLVAAILPEWEQVRNRRQHNPYHRYTVDRHLVETAAEAAALTSRVARPDLLVLAALLHDLGKGQPGDHSDVSAALAADIASRVGLSPADQQTVVRLVQRHLLLVETATRRDVRHAATVNLVADAVVDTETLDLLHALTEADARATGPTAWTAWKATLVDELVAAVDDDLSGREPTTKAWELDRSLQELVDQATGGILVKAEGARLVIIAPDRPGLFAQIAGVLALHGLDVLAADIWSAPGVNEGMAVDDFVLDLRPSQLPDWQRIQHDLAAAMGGAMDIDARLGARALNYEAYGRTPAAPSSEPLVFVDNTASADATVIEVRCANAIGALYRIVRALVVSGLDIRHARVLTLGQDLIDSFYVVDADGRRIDDPGSVGTLQQALLAGLTQQGLGGPVAGAAHAMTGLALGALPVAVLVWLAVRRPRVRVLGGPTPRMEVLYRGQLADVRGCVRVTEVIELGHDILVGYTNVDGDSVTSGGQLLLAGMVLNADVMLAVARWSRDECRLEAVFSVPDVVIGLLHRHSRTAIVMAQG